MSTVLVVEDEPLLRLHAVALLEEAGFAALEAANADQALALLESCKDIAVVFTDIDLRGQVDGVQLARAIRCRWPFVGLVLTSGYVRVRDEDMPERGRFLDKPYDRTELIETIGAVIGGPV